MLKTLVVGALLLMPAALFHGTTARVWEAPDNEPRNFLRTEFVPSFAK